MDPAYCGIHTAQLLHTSCHVSGWCSPDIIYMCGLHLWW